MKQQTIKKHFDLVEIPNESVARPRMMFLTRWSFLVSIFEM